MAGLYKTSLTNLTQQASSMFYSPLLFWLSLLASNTNPRSETREFIKECNPMCFTDRQTGRQADKQTDRQTDRQTQASPVRHHFPLRCATDCFHGNPRDLETLQWAFQVLWLRWKIDTTEILTQTHTHTHTHTHMILVYKLYIVYIQAIESDLLTNEYIYIYIYIAWLLSTHIRALAYGVLLLWKRVSFLVSLCLS